MVGAIVKAPSWLLAASPFHHLSLAPAKPLDLTTLAAMAAIGLGAALIGTFAFSRRDLAEM
jgi:putative exporter of polyketide antibiotics